MEDNYYKAIFLFSFSKQPSLLLNGAVIWKDIPLFKELYACYVKKNKSYVGRRMGQAETRTTQVIVRSA